MKPIAITPNALKQEREKIKEKSKRNALRRAGRPKMTLQGPLPHMELFQREGCAESHRVRRLLGELGLEYISRHPKAGTFPRLIDHESGIRLEGASQIQAYLDSHYSRPQINGLRRYAEKIVGSVEGRADQVMWKLKSVVDRAEHAKQDLTDTVETFKGAAKILRSALRSH